MQPELENEAFECFKERNYLAAERLFRQLVDEATTSDVKDNREQNLASCLAAQGKNEEALEVLKDLPRAETSDITSIYTQAFCLVRTGNFDLALESLARLTLSEKSSPTAHQERDELMRSLLDLIAFCVNASHRWRAHQKNCKIIENVLEKLQEVSKDRQTSEEHYIWKKNVTHIMFMMDTRYETCARHYHDLLLTSQRDASPTDQVEVLSFSNVDPIVLRNLCVCYILTGRNRDAEQLIKEIELDLGEEPNEDADLSSTLYSAGTGTSLLASSFMHSSQALESSQNTDSPLVHVNLAVGTLYCVKNNYEFGMMRIMGTLEPIGKKLTTFSWNQAKRCILSLLDKHCRQLICVQDDLLNRIVEFLMRCEASGILVPANAASPLEDGRNSVTYEARHLRAILLNAIHD